MATSISKISALCSSIRHLPASMRYSIPVRTVHALKNTASFPAYNSIFSRTALPFEGHPTVSGVSSLRRWSTETNSKDAQTEENQGSPGTNGAAAPSADVQALEEKNKKLQAQFDETQDKYRRALAEMENVRQRLNKQVEDAKLFGIQGFCKDLLEVADVLNKATGSVPESELSTNKHLKDLHDGLLLTDAQLVKVFTRHGLVKINPEAGDKFDPNIHEALFQQPAVEGKAPGSVSAVTKVGYKLHNRTLRPAVVGVYLKS